MCAALASLVASSYWSFVALNLRNGTADAKVRVGDRLCLARQPPRGTRPAKEEPRSQRKGTKHPKRDQRNGGGAQTEGRRQKKEAGRKGTDKRERAIGGGQGRREAKLGASPTGNPRFG